MYVRVGKGEGPEGEGPEGDSQFEGLPMEKCTFADATVGHLKYHN